MSVPPTQNIHNQGQRIRDAAIQALTAVSDLRVAGAKVEPQLLNEIGGLCTRMLHLGEHVQATAELIRLSQRQTPDRGVMLALAERSPGFWTAE